MPPVTDRLDTSVVEAAVMRIVQLRGEHSTACPSEVARALSPTDWRKRMPQVRETASQLALQGRIEITQGGEVVEAAPAGGWKGPVRLRLPRS